MKYMFSIVFILCFSFTTKAQTLLKSIENHHGDKIEILCFLNEKGLCENLKIIERKKNGKIFEIIEDNKTIDEVQEDLEFEFHDFKLTNMETRKYEFLKVFKAVCKITDKKTFSLNACYKRVVLSLFSAMMGFVSGGTSVAALQGFFIGGAISSGAFFDLSIVQWPLFYPAIAIDLVRLLTVYPIKSISDKVKQNNFKKRVIPLIEEVQILIAELSQDKDLRYLSLVEETPTVTIKVKNKNYKILKKILLEAQNYDLD